MFSTSGSRRPNEDRKSSIVSVPPSALVPSQGHPPHRSKSMQEKVLAKPSSSLYFLPYSRGNFPACSECLCPPLPHEGDQQVPHSNDLLNGILQKCNEFCNGHVINIRVAQIPTTYCHVETIRLFPDQRVVPFGEDPSIPENALI